MSTTKHFPFFEMQYSHCHVCSGSGIRRKHERGVRVFIQYFFGSYLGQNTIKHTKYHSRWLISVLMLQNETCGITWGQRVSASNDHSSTLLIIFSLTCDEFPSLTCDNFPYFLFFIALRIINQCEKIILGPLCTFHPSYLPLQYARQIYPFQTHGCSLNEEWAVDYSLVVVGI